VPSVDRGEWSTGRRADLAGYRLHQLVGSLFWLLVIMSGVMLNAAVRMIQKNGPHGLPYSGLRKFVSVSSELSCREEDDQGIVGAQSESIYAPPSSTSTSF
jgi:hypothetical protein